MPSAATRRTSSIAATSGSSAALDRLRPARQEDGVWRALGDVAHEPLPELLGQEGHHRRDDAHRLHERRPQRRKAASSSE